MEFEQRSPYYLESEAGYRVSKALIRTVPRYSAWTPAKTLIGIRENAEKAKALCYAHALKNELGQSIGPSIKSPV